MFPWAIKNPLHERVQNDDKNEAVIGVVTGNSGNLIF
jgi:hypothetical protein